MRWRVGFSFLVLLLVSSGIATAELTIEGEIVDAKSREPVPYVNVGVPAGGEGTVSDESGQFSLTLSSADAPVLFTAVGYAAMTIPAARFPLGEPLALQPVEPSFQEQVKVTAKDPGPAEQLGYRNDKPGYKMGFGSGMLGAELAARIKVSKPTYLESAHFTVARTGGERFLYRIHIYDLSTGEIGLDLLNKNVIVEAEQEVGTLSVDLRELGLVVRDDVLLSLEWIRDDREMGNANVMFRAKPRATGGVFLKGTSQMEFIKIPKHTLSFYLMGQRLSGR